MNDLPCINIILHAKICNVNNKYTNSQKYQKHLSYIFCYINIDFNLSILIILIFLSIIDQLLPNTLISILFYNKLLHYYNITLFNYDF